MLYRILLPLVLSVFILNALEISINSGIEQHKRYSLLHLREKQNFTCQEIKNNFDEVTKVVCAYSKKPERPLKSIQNDFFVISSLRKDKTFFLTIKPFYKLKLVPVVFDATQDKSVYDADVTLSKHWVIVGYKEKLPLIYQDEKPSIGINFPFYMDKDMLPYVGGLDIKGNPVHIKKVEDVTDYLRIKKFYEAKKYDMCLELIDSVLEKYPDTLFKAELIFYKIKVYAALKDNDNVIDYSKLFLREYSSDEHIPEVLSFIARGYALIGQNGDADYFFDRLFSEHKDSIYAQWGYIYKGEMTEESGGDSVAEKYYLKALKETNNIDVAVSAAFHLAQLKMQTSSLQAAKYIEKIIKAKPSFFASELKKSLDIMYVFGDVERYKVAADIAKALLDHTNKQKNDHYESLLKDRALWLAKTKYKKEALVALNQYIKEYPDGDFINDIQVAKDSLFFDVVDSNDTQRLAEYDKLIEEYAGDEIANRALYEKAKLLLKEKKYEDVLALQEKLKLLDSEKYGDVESIISDAAIYAMEDALKHEECHSVLSIAKDYNITLSDSWDDGVYKCAMKGGDYQLSKSIAMKNIKSQSLQERKKWLYRYIQVDFATGNYSEVISVSEDLIALIEDEKDSKYKDVYRYLFDTYERLEKNLDMIDAINKIQKEFGITYKDLDRYVAMVGVGEKMGDDMMVIKYGEYGMKIQKESNSHPQSPYLEFSLYQAYINKNELEKALATIKVLDSVELTSKQRSRQKYLLGMVLSKLWRDEEAQKAYDAAIAADPNSAWAELAKSAKSL